MVSICGSAGDGAGRSIGVNAATLPRLRVRREGRLGLSQLRARPASTAFARLLATVLTSVKWPCA
jgi:hypothetical protein